MLGPQLRRESLGWDCESTVWFRWVFAEVRWLGELDFDGEVM